MSALTWSSGLDLLCSAALRRALRHFLRALGLIAMVGLVGAPFARGQGNSFEGRRIAEIRVLDESGHELREQIPALALESGKPFDLEAERESLRTLYRTGRYADIRAQVAPEADGVRLDFLVRPNFFNNVVDIEGLKEPPNEATALAALRLNLGEPFRESALKEGLSRLGDTFREEGLYQAKMDYTLMPHEETHEMDVNLHVVPGVRARIGTIIFHNSSELPDKRILRLSKLSPGKPVTSARLDRAASRLRKALVARDHLGASGSVRRGDYNSQTNRLSLVYDVIAGPKVRVAVTGAHFGAGKLHKLLPIYAEGAVDEDLLQEGRRNLRDSLQRDGYFDADVQYVTSENPQKGERVITYQVDRGKRHRLVSIGFEGNHYFNNELLEGRLQSQTASFASRGHFSQRTVQSDASSISELYRANGFRQTQVTPEVDDDYGGHVGNLYVKFHIQEGPQTRVAELKLDGNKALSDDALLAVIGSTPGQPYSEAGIASDRSNILALYFNEGYADARFEEEVKDAGEANRVNVVYHIVEGPQTRVNRVLLTGYRYTRRGVLARQVQMQPEGPLRESDVVETQRRLYNLGIFNRVAIAPQNPAGYDPDKNVVVQVREGDRYTLGYGFGFEAQRLPGGSTNPTGTTISASPRGLLEISKANVGGRAQTISFKARASTLQYRGVLSFLAPNFLNNPKWNLQLTGFADKTQDVNTFNSSRFEGSFQLVQNLSPSTSFLYRYFYRHVIVQASSLKISPDQIPLFSQPTKISGFGVTWLRDRRNNPGDASRGSFNTVDIGVAPQSLGSSASFVRLLVQNSTFHPFGRAFVFARSTRFGVEETFSGTTEQQIPLPERYFAGGATTLRGFGLNQAGPRDPVTGFPIGGLAMLMFNQELRFPMRLPFVGNRIGGTLFYDAGNVFSDVNRITLRLSPPSPTDLNYLSHTIGFGLRYGTPIGPVRVDFGYQLNPAKFQFQNATTHALETERLPHFQFFFNIGPIF